MGYAYDHTFGEDCKVRVRVLDLKTGRLRRSLRPGRLHYPNAENSLDPPPCSTYPERIVMKRNASVAWVATQLRTSQPSWYKVIRVDSRGRKLLDSGPAIDPRSLHRRGDVITWTGDGRRHSARLH